MSEHDPIVISDTPGSLQTRCPGAPTLVYFHGEECGLRTVTHIEAALGTCLGGNQKAGLTRFPRCSGYCKRKAQVSSPASDQSLQRCVCLQSLSQTWGLAMLREPHCIMPHSLLNPLSSPFLPSSSPLTCPSSVLLSTSTRASGLSSHSACRSPSPLCGTACAPIHNI